MLVKNFDDLHWQNLKPFTFVITKEIFGGTAGRQLFMYARGKHVYVLSRYGIIHYTKYRWNDNQFDYFKKNPKEAVHIEEGTPKTIQHFMQLSANAVGKKLADAPPQWVMTGAYDLIEINKIAKQKGLKISMPRYKDILIKRIFRGGFDPEDLR
jgi:hypothetical protein